MQNPGSICRDYLRNVCKRSSSQCRFEHPPRVISNASNPYQDAPAQDRTQDTMSQLDKVSVCRDFARGSCPRSHCRFIHLTPVEVQQYASTGQLPERIIFARANGLKLQSADVEALNGSIPLCRDYLKGICIRRDTCRYLHLNNLTHPLSGNTRSNSNGSQAAFVDTQTVDTTEVDFDESPPLIKRMRATSSGIFEIQSPDESIPAQATPNETFSTVSGDSSNNPVVVGSRRRRSSISGLSPAGDHYDPFNQSPPFPSPSDSTTSGGSSIGGGHHRSLSNRRSVASIKRPCSTCLGCNNLQTENRSLRMKVMELEKQVNNLSTTNDVLLAQNAKLRTNKVTPFQHSNQYSNRANASAPVAAVQTPPSNNTNNLSGNNTHSQLSSVPAPPPPPPQEPHLPRNLHDNIPSNHCGVPQGRFAAAPTAIQVANGATVGTVHLTAHRGDPNATTPANVNATAVPYFITQLTPNFATLNPAGSGPSLNVSAVQNNGAAVGVPNSLRAAAILPHPANQVVAAGQPLAIAGSAQYTPTFLLPHVTTTVNSASAPATLSLTPLAAAAGYTGQIYNLRPASGTTYHLTPASAQTVCINALQAAPNMSPVVFPHNPSTLGQSMGPPGTTAVFQTLQPIQASSRLSSPSN